MGAEGRASGVVFVWLLAAAALILAAPAPSRAAAAPVVDAGALRAEVGAEPWSLALTAPGGDTVLAQHPGTGSGPTGTLGFRTASGWQHATRILEQHSLPGGGWAATLASADVAGRTIELRLTPEAEGVIGLDARIGGTAPMADVEAIGIGFSAREGERYLGFGERSNAVDQRGGNVENYVSDGPYQRSEYPFLTPSCRPGGCASAPTRPTSRSRGCSRAPATACSSTTPRRASSGSPAMTRAAGAPRSCGRPRVRRGRRRPRRRRGCGCASSPARPRPRRCAATPSPRAASRCRQRPGSTAPGIRTTSRRATGSRRCAQRMSRSPPSQTYLHYLPCGAQRGVEAEQPARTAAAHAQGLAITTYFNPMVCSNYGAAYGPASAAGALTRTAAGAAVSVPLWRQPDRCQHRRSVRLLQGARPRALRRAPAGGDRRRLRRLDGGLRRVHAARLGLRRGDRRQPRPQPVSDRLPLRRLRGQPRRAATDRPLPALGLDRVGAVRAGRLGR